MHGTTSLKFVYISCVYKLIYKMIRCVGVCEPVELTPISFFDHPASLVRILESFFSIGIFVLLTRK